MTNTPDYSFSLEYRGNKMKQLTQVRQNPMHRIGPMQEQAMFHRKHIPITLPKAPWDKVHVHS